MAGDQDAVTPSWTRSQEDEEPRQRFKEKLQEFRRLPPTDKELTAVSEPISLKQTHALSLIPKVSPPVKLDLTPIKRDQSFAFGCHSCWGIQEMLMRDSVEGLRKVDKYHREGAPFSRAQPHTTRQQREFLRAASRSNKTSLSWMNMKISIFAGVLLISAVVLSVDGETPAERFEKQHIHPKMKAAGCTAVMAAKSRQINRPGDECKKFNTFIKATLAEVKPICGNEGGYFIAPVTCHRRLPSQRRLETWMPSQEWTTNCLDVKNVLSQWGPQESVSDVARGKGILKLTKSQKWTGLV
ncbi:hypothetical protein FQN60_012483 [Etheostoma spectabile]|uniref:Ribonuclease A-domain domain-containing protein n=1 Tax=Etheostoma spectabile TaxID=54343 RepID=A0A5J5DQ77_9PERO|nr:hypothetical protein FQN60_012483 [Etheostoma spectabile]